MPSKAVYKTAHTCQIVNMKRESFSKHWNTWNYPDFSHHADKESYLFNLMLLKMSYTNMFLISYKNHQIWGKNSSKYNCVFIFFPFYLLRTQTTNILNNENPKEKWRKEDVVLKISQTVCVMNSIIDNFVNDSFEIF